MVQVQLFIVYVCHGMKQMVIVRLVATL